MKPSLIPEPFGPVYPQLPVVKKFRSMAASAGGVAAMDKALRHAYGEAVEQAIRAKQRSELQRELPRMFATQQRPSCSGSILQRMVIRVFTTMHEGPSPQGDGENASPILGGTCLSCRAGRRSCLGCRTDTLEASPTAAVRRRAEMHRSSSFQHRYPPIAGCLAGLPEQQSGDFRQLF
jgi:hypothetical protein